MNEENNVDIEQSVEKDVLSSETSDVNEEQKVHTSEPEQIQEEAENYTELLEQVQQINLKMDNITNISIVCMVGVGMVVGIIACSIFARYFKS